MRFIALLLVAMIATACSTNPVVGKWKPVRTYDPLRRTMVPFSYEGILEVSNDGTFKAILPDGPQRTGQYKLEEGVTPHRFTATQKDGRTVRGIYSVADELLRIRIADDESATSRFPTNFTDPDNDAKLRAIEFERKK